MARDHGLQPERTALAWSRTALATLVNALILLRAGLVGEHLLLLAIGGLLLLAAGLVQAFATTRQRTLTDADTAGPQVAAPAAMLLAIALFAALGSAGALLAITTTAGRG